jgi:hypothetical protein
MHCTAPLLALSMLLVLPACSKGSPPPPSGAATSALAAPGDRAPGLGEVMLQVAHRFEYAGRAAAANRWELASFEVGELEELFENDVPRASLPKEGPTAQIPGLAKTFLQTMVPELGKAAAAGDHVAFAAAFQRASAMCNACHQSAEKGFIEVPSVPGQPVPVLDPLPAPASRR